MLKLKRGLSPVLIKEMIAQNRQNTYELRNNTDFTLPLVKSVHKGLGSLSYLGPKIWKILPVQIKQTESLLQYKAKIKNWNLLSCPCRLCKVYLQHVVHLGHKQYENFEFSVMAFFGTSEQSTINLWVCSHLPGWSSSEDSTFCALRIANIVTFYLNYNLAFS